MMKEEPQDMGMSEEVDNTEVINTEVAETEVVEAETPWPVEQIKQQRKTTIETVKNTRKGHISQLGGQYNEQIRVILKAKATYLKSVHDPTKTDELVAMTEALMPYGKEHEEHEEQEKKKKKGRQQRNKGPKDDNDVNDRGDVLRKYFKPDNEDNVNLR